MLSKTEITLHQLPFNFVMAMIESLIELDSKKIREQISDNEEARTFLAEHFEIAEVHLFDSDRIGLVWTSQANESDPDNLRIIFEQQSRYLEMGHLPLLQIILVHVHWQFIQASTLEKMSQNCWE